MMKLHRLAVRAGLAAAALLAAAPAFAQTAPTDPTFSSIPAADRLTLAGVFAHATIPVKVVLWGLAAALIAAVAVWIIQALRLGQRSSDGVAGGLAYLSAQAVAAPLFGLFGASYALMNCFIGIANVRPTPSLTVLAPGFAEASLSVGLGLLAGAIAVVGGRHLKARLYAAGQDAPAVGRPASPSSHPARAIA